MSRVCQVTGKQPLSGNNVSHAKTERAEDFYPICTRIDFGWILKKICKIKSLQ